VNSTALSFGTTGYFVITWAKVFAYRAILRHNVSVLHLDADQVVLKDALRWAKLHCSNKPPAECMAGLAGLQGSSMYVASMFLCGHW
jgi:hypothetical protein